MNDELRSCVDVLESLQCLRPSSRFIIWITLPLVKHSEEVSHRVEDDELYHWEECIEHHSRRESLSNIEEPLRVKVWIDAVEEIVHPRACVSTVPRCNDVEYTSVEKLNVEHAILDEVDLMCQNWLTDPEHKCDEQ